MASKWVAALKGVGGLFGKCSGLKLCGGGREGASKPRLLRARNSQRERFWNLAVENEDIFNPPYADRSVVF